MSHAEISQQPTDPGVLPKVGFFAFRYGRERGESDDREWLLLLEYAVEMNRLIEMEMEGSVG